MAYIGRQPTVGNFRICDAISVVNGQAAYTMQVGGVNVIPESANNMIVSLNGVIQKPGSSYTVSSSTITFSSNLSTGDVIDFIQILGGVANIGTPSDGTVTSAKINYPLTTFSSTGIDDNASSTAITISDGKVGIGTTAPDDTLHVKGNVVLEDSSPEITFETTSTSKYNWQLSAQENIDQGFEISYGSQDANASDDTFTPIAVFKTNRVGINTSSPHSISNLHVADTYANEPMIRIETSESGNKRLDLYVGGGHGYVTARQSAQNLNLDARTNLIFNSGSTAGTERMRITSDGKFGMNGRTNPQYTLEFGDSGTGNGWSINAENNVHKIRTRASAGDTQTHVQWENTNGIVGSVKTNGSATQYNTSSDYRLKENVSYDFDATTRLKQLKPARFNFIADDTDTLVDGFIAHEVSTIVPEAVSGAKDGMFAEVLYEEGDELPEGKNVGDVKTPARIDPQGLDQSKLVPLLVKTIQELEARITALES